MERHNIDNKDKLLLYRTDLSETVPFSKGICCAMVLNECSADFSLISRTH